MLCLTHSTRLYDCMQHSGDDWLKNDIAISSHNTDVYFRVSGNWCSESCTFPDVNEVVSVFSTLFARFRLNLSQELYKHLLSDVVIMKIGTVTAIFTCEISGSCRNVEEVCLLTQRVFIVVYRCYGTCCRSRLHWTDRMSWYVGEQLPTCCVTTPKGAGPVLQSARGYLLSDLVKTRCDTSALSSDEYFWAS